MLRTILAVTQFALLALCPVGGAEALILRHDRPDARALELGADFDAVGSVGPGRGDGTLIAPTWVLTAAHVAQGAEASRLGVRFGDDEYPVAAIYSHPDHRAMGPHDIALLRLEGPVEGISPVALERGPVDDGLEVVFVGHGAQGRGDSTERSEDGARRAVTNRVHTTAEHHLVFRFEEPPAGTDMEGIPGPGDSGGPALARFDDEYRVVGVSSLGQPGRLGPGTYGALDYFGRISTHHEWIDAVLAGHVQADAVGASIDLEKLAERSPAARRMLALTQLFSSEAPEDYESFAAENFAPDVLERNGAAALGEILQKLLNDLRGRRPVGILMDTPTQLDLAWSDGQSDMILGVMVQKKEPHLMVGLAVGEGD